MDNMGMELDIFEGFFLKKKNAILPIILLFYREKSKKQNPIVLSL